PHQSAARQGRLPRTRADLPGRARTAEGHGLMEVLKWLGLFILAGVIWFTFALVVAWAFGRWMDEQRQLDERDHRAELERRRRGVAHVGQVPASQNGHFSTRTGGNVTGEGLDKPA